MNFHSAPDTLGPAERIRFHALLLASIRRMESIYIQEQIGSLESDLARGFELSLLSLLSLFQTEGAAGWWSTAKVTFSPRFVEHVDAWLADHPASTAHPSMGIESN